MRAVILGLLLLLAGFAPVFGNTEPTELELLETSLDEAVTQTDLNLASYKLSQYLEAKLLNVEESIKTDLGPESLMLFNKAAESWRQYRKAQVVYEGSRYAGGSIQPLIHNLTYIQLTKERLNNLESNQDEDR